MGKRINPFKKFHGAYIPNFLLRRPEISFGGKTLYARLSQYAGEKGFAYPSRRTLAEDLGSSLTAIKRYLHELEDLKLIEIESGGVEETNKYFFLDHDWMMGAEIEPPGGPKANPGGAESGPRGGPKVDPGGGRKWATK